MKSIRRSNRYTSVVAMWSLGAALIGAPSCGTTDDICPTGQARFADACVSPTGTVQVPDAAATDAVIDIGNTGAKLIIPQGAISGPLEVSWRIRTLTAQEKDVNGQQLLPQEIDFGPEGTVFNTPLMLELPISWPSGYDAMTSGIRVIPVAAYARTDGEVWRDNLSTFAGVDDGVGWVILDATKSPRKATGLVFLDHFSSHTLVIPSPTVEFDGQAAFTTRAVTGSTYPINVPTGLFAHGVFDILTLDSPQSRRDLYRVELLELVRQTNTARNTLWKGYDEVFSKVLDATDAASTSKEFGKVAAGLSYMAALNSNGKAVERLEEWSSGFLKLSNSLAKVEKLGIAKTTQVVQCLSSGALQLWVLTTLDDELVAARWAAAKAKLLASPLGKGDIALQQAISDVDSLVAASAGVQFHQKLIEYVDKVGAGLAVPECSDFLTGSISGFVSKAVVNGVIANALSTAKPGIATTLAGGVAVALASALIEDWATKDVFMATKNGERLAILASLLSGGELGEFPDLEMTADSNGILKVSVPEVLDYAETSSAPYLRLQVATYAQSAIFTTLAGVVRRDDISLTYQFFDDFKNAWCEISSSCPSGWGIDLMADSFEQVSWSNDKALQSLVSTFAACGIPGACLAKCNDPNNDGYGEGTLCIGPEGPNAGPSCFDGIKNQNETGIDCGGVCPACSGMGCPSGNGLYCGKTALGQNQSYLYSCNNGNYTVASTCNGQGCQINAQGNNDSCSGLSCPSGDGLYCGQAALGQNSGHLYSCSGGSYSLTSTCNGQGCQTNAQGTNDSCIAGANCSDGIQNQGETGIDCGGPCQSCQSQCFDGICNGAETCSSCPADCGTCAPCGQSSQACCAGNTCSSPYQCNGGTCGCGTGNNGQFNVTASAYPNSWAVGCDGDGNMKLKASAEMVASGVLRIRVRKADDSVFTSGGTLSLYVGNGPTCPNPPNAVKTTQPVTNGTSEQIIDLTVNPYGASWNLDETKTFWVGKDEGGNQSWRATGTMSVKRICM